MKLRIKGDSLRLRISPSEMKRLMEQRSVEETVHFGAAEGARLTYALDVQDAAEMTVQQDGPRVAVVLPLEQARAWAAGEDVGVYGAVPLPGGQLELAVEKDWACLDKGDADNADTFPNPNDGAVC